MLSYSPEQSNAFWQKIDMVFSLYPLEILESTHAQVKYIKVTN